MFSTPSKILKLFAVPAIVASYVSAAANTLQQVTNFGPNPTGLEMYVYKPTGLVANPALVVAIHLCPLNAQITFASTQYANLADQHQNYMVIYPNAVTSCWDVHTNTSLTHNGGSDSLGIASMVRYAIANYGVDASKVYATGQSYGGMMTSVLAGAYPDLFAGGSAYSGVPYGCFAGPNLWNNACANGTLIQTGQQWGDLVRSGYPGYTGPRPKMQIWHGTTDGTVNFTAFVEETKQWTNVFGYSSSPISSTQNDPVTGWTRMAYGPNFQAISTSSGAYVPVQETDTLKWFGILP